MKTSPGFLFGKRKNGKRSTFRNRNNRPFDPGAMKADDASELRRYCTNYSLGHDKALNYQLACAFGVVLAMIDDQEAYQTLIDDEMFDGMRQPPEHEDVVVWVLLYTFCANAGQKRGRVRRYAPILNRYLIEKVSADKVEEKLKEEGGIGAAYRLSTANNARLEAGELGVISQYKDQDQDEDQEQDDQKQDVDEDHVLPGDHDDQDDDAFGHSEHSQEDDSPGYKASLRGENEVELKVLSRWAEARAALRPGPATFSVMVESKPKPTDPEWKDIRLLRVKQRRNRARRP